MQSGPRTELAPASPEASSDGASRIQQIVDDLYRKYRGVEDGEVATYIPELGKANPKRFRNLCGDGGRADLSGR